MTRTAWRNVLTFGPGTFGRDMVYGLVATYFIFFVTEVARPGTAAIVWLTGIMLVIRLFDAVLDFVMGSVIERTRSRWGQYKPWMVAGALLSGLMTMGLFTDTPHLDGWAFVVSFSLTYLLWGVAWSMNDISYWSLLPALSVDPHERAAIGSMARVWSTVGTFAVVIATLPVTSWLARRPGSDDRHAWAILAVGAVVVMIAFQFITVVGVRQPGSLSRPQHTTLREIVSVFRENDQLRWLAVSMTLFFVGFQTTTTFGPYYFKYVYLDENTFSGFAAVVGVAQLAGFALFPLLSRLLDRMRLFLLACGGVFLAYVGFFLTGHNLLLLSVCGFVIFVGNATILMLMIVLLSDTIEYGQWKVGRRHGPVTFAVQPFIFKASLAIATALVGGTTVLTGIASAPDVLNVGASARLLLKTVMLLVPLGLMIAATVMFRRHFRITAELHERIVAELRARGELEDRKSVV